ncbi:MAG: hypothetical protein HOM11_12725 [Methylococcales bacterium]|jgi:hypothetical protein|nr:hypothetical protein [Methylococcales bacterium]MBT7445335.1 hypothetical protein [Methylococcales bacterium]
MKLHVLFVLLSSLWMTTAFATEEIKPLAITGDDIEAQVLALSKTDRIRFGKHLAQTICKSCHHKDFTGKTFFENDEHMRQNQLKQQKNHLTIKIRSKMRHKQMPPDEWKRLEKYEWQSIYKYVKHIEKTMRKSM